MRNAMRDARDARKRESERLWKSRASLPLLFSVMLSQKNNSYFALMVRRCDKSDTGRQAGLETDQT